MSHSYKRLSDDEWFDEIQLIGTAAAVFALVTVPRYKTSGLSGDEWRTSAMWRTTLPLGDERERGRREDGWADFDGGYHGLDTGCKALFPGVVAGSSHQPPETQPLGIV